MSLPQIAVMAGVVVISAVKLVAQLSENVHLAPWPELYAQFVELMTMPPPPVGTRSRGALGPRHCAGMEISTAKSEPTNLLDKRGRLTEKPMRAAPGENTESMEVDEDFLMALETGMPPSGGLGADVARLISLLTNTRGLGAPWR